MACQTLFLVFVHIYNNKQIEFLRVYFYMEVEGILDKLSTFGM